MFSRIKQAMAARRAARQMEQQRLHRLLAALVRQAQAAATVRHLALVQALALRWLPARLRLVLDLALQQRLLALPIHMPGSQKSTACSARTAKRSTSKRRRAR